MQPQPAMPASLMTCWYEGITTPHRTAEGLQQLAQLFDCKHASLAVWGGRCDWGVLYQATYSQSGWKLTFDEHVLPSADQQKLVSNINPGKWQILQARHHLKPVSIATQAMTQIESALGIRINNGKGCEAFLLIRKAGQSWHPTSAILQLASEVVKSLQSALELMMQLRELTSSALHLSTAFDCIRMPILMLNQAMHVLVANAQARCMLSSIQHNGSGRERILLKNVPSEKLAELVQRACGKKGVVTASAFQISTSNKQSPVQVIVLPILLKSMLPHAEHAALIVLHAENDFAESADLLLQNIYGLTAAEARLTLRILHGESPTAAASELQVSLPTVRTQLSSVLKKTGAIRQSDLVRRLSALLLIN